jgi:hypothetical protein
MVAALPNLIGEEQLGVLVFACGFAPVGAPEDIEDIG